MITNQFLENPQEMFSGNEQSIVWTLSYRTRIQNVTTSFLQSPDANYNLKSASTTSSFKHEVVRSLVSYNLSVSKYKL